MPYTFFGQDEVVLLKVAPAHENVLKRVAAALVHFQEENMVPGRAQVRHVGLLAVPVLDYGFASARLGILESHIVLGW
jgi:hypothetical protein